MFFENPTLLSFNQNKCEISWKLISPFFHLSRKNDQTNKGNGEEVRFLEQSNHIKSEKLSRRIRDVLGV